MRLVLGTTAKGHLLACISLGHRNLSRPLNNPALLNNRPKRHVCLRRVGDRLGTDQGKELFKVRANKPTHGGLPPTHVPPLTCPPFLRAVFID